MKTKKTLRADLILLGGMLAAGLILFAVLMLTRTQGASVEVYVDNALNMTCPLSKNAVYTISSADGGENVLVVEGGGARMESASCPDGLCVNMGTIRCNGESIVCLPNKVVARVVGGEEADTDIIAGSVH